MDAVKPGLVHFLPILTTLFSAFFLAQISARYRERRGLHLLWWSIGVLTYGLGTLLESTITLTGNSIALTKMWYVAGAVLGGYPLAQGSVYLHLSRRKADWLTRLSLPLVAIAAIFVFLSPVDASRLEVYRPSGAILAWQWVRLLTPFINGYAAIFLIGTAAWSAVRFFRIADRPRAAGNILISVGALLPGIGGGMAKAGVVEALYIGEFVGIMLIYAGYRLCLLPGSEDRVPRVRGRRR